MKTKRLYFFIIISLVGCTYPRIEQEAEIANLIIDRSVYGSYIYGSQEIKFKHYFSPDGSLYKSSENEPGRFYKDNWYIEDGKLCEYRGEELNQLTWIGCYYVLKTNSRFMLERATDEKQAMKHYQVYKVDRGDIYNLVSHYQDLDSPELVAQSRQPILPPIIHTPKPSTIYQNTQVKQNKLSHNNSNSVSTSTNNRQPGYSSSYNSNQEMGRLEKFEEMVDMIMPINSQPKPIEPQINFGRHRTTRNVGWPFSKQYLEQERLEPDTAPNVEANQDK